jgi:hypothetical protein
MGRAGAEDSRNRARAGKSEQALPGFDHSVLTRADEMIE